MATATDHGSLVREVYDAYNSREFDRAVALASDDFVFTMVATGQTFNGPEGLRQFLAGWDAGFPESSVEVTNMVVGDDQVAVEYTGSGVHSGTLATPTGEIPATGKSAQLNFCDVYQIRDGKLASGRNYFDLVTMLRQLGLAD